jgi:hypothetical protein
MSALRKLFVSIFLSIVFLTSVHAVNGSTVLFNDDFENENINQWTSVRGPANLWKIKYSDVGKSNMFGARIDSESTIIDSVALAKNLNTPSYVLDFDYLPVLSSGVDNSLDSRWIYNSSNDTYDVKEVHYLGSNGVWTNFGCSQFISIPKLNYGEINHIKIIYDAQRMQFFLNGGQLLDYTDQNYVFSGKEYVGARISTGTAYPTEAWFDNIIVATLDATPSPTLSPSPSPSPSSTPSPSPTPTPINLNVPVLKQTSSPWGSQVYDSARNWAKKDYAISSWGCALTSAAMILKYYGINLLPGRIALDPGTLNTWLDSQKDGYVGQGFVNWLSLSRLSKIASSINGVGFDALEYSRKNTSDPNVLKNDINNFTPDILEEPGHFIVAKGITENTFNINDPYFNRFTLNDGYSNSFLNLGTYTKSSTDLSYIMITSDANVTINLDDNNGKSFGDNFIEQSIINDQNSNEKNSPLKIYYFSKPNTQRYTVAISSSVKKLTNIAIYLYGEDGSVNVIKENTLLGNESRKFRIYFDKTNPNKCNLVRIISIDDFISDIAQLNNLKLIHFGFANGLKISAEVIKNNIEKNNNKAAVVKLKALREIIKIVPGVLIAKEARDYLLSDIAALLGN